jgi:hypothetical protein
MRNISTIGKYAAVFSSGYSEFYQNDMISQINSKLNSGRGGIAGAHFAKSMLCGVSTPKMSFLLGANSSNSAVDISTSLSTSSSTSCSLALSDN